MAFPLLMRAEWLISRTTFYRTKTKLKMCTTMIACQSSFPRDFHAFAKAYVTKQHPFTTRFLVNAATSSCKVIRVSLSIHSILTTVIMFRTWIRRHWSERRHLSRMDSRSVVGDGCMGVVRAGCSPKRVRSPPSLCRPSCYLCSLPLPLSPLHPPQLRSPHLPNHRQSTSPPPPPPPPRRRSLISPFFPYFPISLRRPFHEGYSKMTDEDDRTDEDDPTTFS
jgi:hypothetical protein